MCLLKSATTNDQMLDKYIDVIDEIKSKCINEQIINMPSFIREHKIIGNFFQLLVEWKAIRMIVGDVGDVIFEWIYVKPDNVGESFLADKLVSVQRQQARDNAEKNKIKQHTPLVTTKVVKLPITQQTYDMNTDEAIYAKYCKVLQILKDRCGNNEIIVPKTFSKEHNITSRFMPLLVEMGIIDKPDYRIPDNKNKKAKWLAGDRAIDNIIKEYIIKARTTDANVTRKNKKKHTAKPKTFAKYLDIITIIKQNCVDGKPVDDDLLKLHHIDMTLISILKSVGVIRRNGQRMEWIADNNIGMNTIVNKYFDAKRKYRRADESTKPETLKTKSEIKNVELINPTSVKSGDQQLVYVVKEYKNELESINLVYNKICRDYMEAKMAYDKSGKDFDKLTMDMYKTNMDTMKAKHDDINNKIQTLEKLISI